VPKSIDHVGGIFCEEISEKGIHNLFLNYLCFLLDHFEMHNNDLSLLLSDSHVVYTKSNQYLLEDTSGELEITLAEVFVIDQLQHLGLSCAYFGD
jgi:hypothetical protein